MLISKNSSSSLDEFSSLVMKVVTYLNRDIQKGADRELYYLTRNGTKLENDIYKILSKLAVGTSFEGTIELISNQKFPDIVAGKYFGVEVKTSKSGWISTGSSIVESTRKEDVERIFMLYGKLSEPIEFRAKPYEECLSEIVVTHSPRYKIDMNLTEERTIFGKMGIDYDSFRKSDNSIGIVKKYYRSKLKEGQELWWMTDIDIDNLALSPIVRLWSTLEISEKRSLEIKGFAWFPEIFSNSSTKYNRFALWLATQNGIVPTSLRDIFTAGGKMSVQYGETVWTKQSQIVYRLSLHIDEIQEEIMRAEDSWIREMWDTDYVLEGSDKIKQWIELVNDYSQESLKEMLYKLLEIE